MCRGTFQIAHAKLSACLIQAPSEGEAAASSSLIRDCHALCQVTFELLAEVKVVILKAENQEMSISSWGNSMCTAQRCKDYEI